MKQFSRTAGNQSDGGKATGTIRNPQSAIRNPILPDIDYDELLEPVRFHFAIDRRSFVQMLGAGALVTAIGTPLLAQRGRGRGRGGRRGGGGFRGGPPPALSARIHFADDGMITVLSGKVDGGQGSRGELAQAAAEELRVPLDKVKVVLADTSMVPNDGRSARRETRRTNAFQR
jgi:isoquinoline 1-oxidoreductase